MSQADDQNFIEQAMPAFVSEAREQIESIEQLLLQLEAAPDDRELLDALFRCAHTVKGSSGIFGLDKVVAFTHHVETLLDKMRDGELSLTPELSTLLLQCNDQIGHLVETAATPEADSEHHVEARADLVTRLQAAMGDSAPMTTAGSRPASTGGSEGATSGKQRWHLSVRFGKECFRNGMDPLSILRYLGTLGTIEAIGCDVMGVPLLDDLDPEECHLGFELGLVTDADRTAIESAFSFVKDDCTFKLIPPQAPPEHYLSLIEALPDGPRLGDILVAVGAITQDQLTHALNSQKGFQSTSLDEEPPKLGDILHKEAGIAKEVVTSAVAKQRQRDSVVTDDSRYIRVQADRLDEVINLLGELVIAGAGAALLANQSRQAALIEANQQSSRLIEEIRNSTLQLRMVPIGETFSRFRRVVRDTAASLDKEVGLEIEGGDTELDKSMVEKIADPLMHLVRNGLDHGLETPEERQAAGKPRQGRLVLSARHDSGSVLIRIQDDGRGIHREKLLKRARERGIIGQDAVLSDADTLKLIFEPGFSTAEKITNLSGRGVGMDVVRRNIEALRGTVQVDSTWGQGTRIDIRLPLTLAIIDGFLVGVGNSRFILPLESVNEVVESRPAQTQMDAQGRHCVELRGVVLPVVSLRRLYALEGKEPERVSIVVASSNQVRFGIVVDQLLGQHQTVIKPLGRMFRTLRGISGSSILGNGDVALIFDVNSLSELASMPTRHSAPEMAP